jgi:5S rRNA maturation endonuclease (ribonuclease M5)
MTRERNNDELERKSRNELLRIFREEILSLPSADLDSEGDNYREILGEYFGLYTRLMIERAEARDKKEYYKIAAIDNQIKIVDNLKKIAGIHAVETGKSLHRPPVEYAKEYEELVKEGFGTTQKISDQFLMRAIADVREQRRVPPTAVALNTAKFSDIIELLISNYGIKESTVTEPTELEEIFRLEPKEIVDFLSRWGYETESYEQYIIARHKNLSHKIFVKLAERSSYKQYDRVKSIILTSRRFREMILRYLASRFEPSKINASKLLTDVITPFGWNIGINDQKRHHALEAASGFWGEQHILHLLNLLQNEWSNHPTLYVYKNVIKSEHNWFERTHVTDSVYIVQKNKLIEELKSEYEHILSRALPSQTRNSNIDHWFVVVY